MPTTLVNPVSLIAKFCSLDERYHVARGLMVLIPDPESESEFQSTASAILNNLPEIEKLAAGAKDNLTLSRRLLNKNNKSALAAMLIKVSLSKLNLGIAGLKARRYLAAMALEIVILNPNLIMDDAIAALGRIVRQEIDKGTRHSAIPDPQSLLGLIAWLNNQRQGTTRFTTEFWNYWRNIIQSLAWEIVNAKPNNPSWLYEPGIDDQGIEFSLLPEPEQKGFAPNVIIVPDPVTDLERKRSSGTELVISDAQLSTYTQLYSLTECSTTILTDNEVKGLIKEILADLDGLWKNHDLAACYASIGQLLMLATGSSSSNILNLKWVGNPNNILPLTEGISIDKSWFFRREYIPEKAVGSESEKQNRFVWIPIPTVLKNWLHKIISNPKPNQFVLSALHGSHLIKMRDKITETHLRRTFFSRLSRLEPLGITGAQWACGDSFGIDISPIFYDRYSADALASLIEKVTFPWFGEKPGKARVYRPKHYLGSRVPHFQVAYGKLLRENIDNVPLGIGIDELIARVNLRTWNLVHGIVISTGHRPNNNFRKLTLKSFDLTEGIGILSDKAASPSWQHRPVSIPESICAEICILVDELKLLSTKCAGTELDKHIAMAISGKGPLFLKIHSVQAIEVFGNDQYLQNLPAELIEYPNFARHWLNQFLIGNASEMLRVGQLGWHGAREGAWSNISPISVREGCKKLQPILTKYLKSIGWIPLGHSPINKVCIEDITIDWIDCERKHERQYRAKVNELKRADAARQMQAAKLMLPNLQSLFNDKWPNTFKIDGFRLDLCNIPNENSEKVEITRMDIEQMARSISPGDPRRQARSTAFNILSLMFRIAKKRGLIDGQIPQRRMFSYGSGPGQFVECAPMALTASRSLENWLLSADNKLSLPARTLLALLHFGGYTEINCLVQVLKKDTLLVRSNSNPDVILAQPTDQRQTLAFHGMAALYLARWHNDLVNDIPPLPLLEAEIFIHLPLALRPDSDKVVLKHLAALARVRNSLAMDGLARYVGTEKVCLTTTSATRIVALYDNLSATPAVISDNQDRIGPSSGKSLSAKSKSDALTIRSITSRISKCQVHRRPRKKSDKEVRAELREWLSSKLRSNIAEPSIEHLLARFAVALLDDKAPNSGLEFITIFGYINVIAYPLKTFLGNTPLSQSEDVWQEAFIQIVASSTPDMRIRKRDALLRFYNALSPHVGLPNVNFDVLSAIAGSRSLSVNPGYLTDAEVHLIADILKKDIEDLNQQHACAEEIYEAKARLLYFHIITATTFRPREAWTIGIGDISLKNECTQITIRRWGFQQIKTNRSRRRDSLKGPMAKQARILIEEWLNMLTLKGVNMFNTNQPFFGKMNDSKTLIERDHISNRINELVRWATNDPSAVAYWTRKSDIHRSLTVFQKNNQDSLWSARDILSRAGQASIKTTLSSYMHDPILVFYKWFHSDVKYFDIRHVGQVLNCSSSTINRKLHDRTIRARGDADIRSRMAALLNSIPIAHVEPKEIHPPLALVCGSKFNPTTADIDAILRAFAKGQNLTVAAGHRSWPSVSINHLEQALEQLKSFGFEFQRYPQSTVVIDPPRIIQAYSTKPESGYVLQLGQLKFDHKTLIEMAESWLRYAALLGIDKGIPGTSLEWAQWEIVVGTDSSINWPVQKIIHLECRLPVLQLGSATSSWHMLRWNLILYWLKFRIECVKNK